MRGADRGGMFDDRPRERLACSVYPNGWIVAHTYGSVTRTSATYEVSSVPFGRMKADEFGVPRAMAEMVENGYYAVRKNKDSDWVFLRVSRPDSGQYKDHIKVQTQHGEVLREVFFVLPEDHSSGADFRVLNGDIRDLMIQLVTGPQLAAVMYGREARQCCRCGKPLTDPRSRKYGIGPECEKYWPEIIELVDGDSELNSEDEDEEHEPYF